MWAHVTIVAWCNYMPIPYLCLAFRKSSKCRNFGFGSCLISPRKFPFDALGSEFGSSINRLNSLCCMVCSRFDASVEYISSNANIIIGISNCKLIWNWPTWEIAIVPSNFSENQKILNWIWSWTLRLMMKWIRIL